jgi:glycosyltransferase involved in cell wall biosynthesis
MFVINGVSADTRVIREAATLAGAGHQVTVLGMREGRQAPQEAVEGFRVERLRPDPQPRGIEASGGTQAPGPLGLAWALFDYWRRAVVRGRQLRADVYHAHDLTTLPAAWAASLGSPARLVYDAHELFTEIGRLGTLPRLVFRVLERLLIGRADRRITVNGSIAAELARRYGIPAPVVIRNCPRSLGRPPSRDESPLRERAGVPPGVPLALFQGMFMPHRGLENLVRAVPRLRSAHVVFMGWGPLAGPLTELARAEGVADRVHVIPGVPLADLLVFTAGADVGVIPYRNIGLNNYYTSPNKLFEYVASGVPVAASRFPELVRVVEGLGLGRTFDPERPEDIAAALDALLEDPAALAEARGRVAAAAPDFTWEAESRKLLDLYAGLDIMAPMPLPAARP